MGKRPKPIKRSTPKHFYCATCGKGLDSGNMIWSWKDGPTIYCSEKCKEELEGKK